MKEKPALEDRRILCLLRETYGIENAEVKFLPIGDISSAKYRVETNEEAAYFLKLKKGVFTEIKEIKEISVTVPYFLHEQGIHQVLSPLKTKDGRLWTHLDPFTCILFPYLSGENGFQNQLTDDQWQELGAALKSIHSATLPDEFVKEMPRETFSSIWRERVKDFLLQAENTSYEDLTAVKMAIVLQEHRDEIRFVIERAEQLAKTLQSQPKDMVLCHTDIHAGNLLLETNAALHIIDWDDPMMAPKERDLMFIGGGIGGIWNTSREESLFYQGYGGKDINLTALTYYRYERIVSDIGEFSQQILSTTEGGADRERSLQKFYSAFLPNQVFDIAHRTDQILNGRQFT